MATPSTHLLGQRELHSLNTNRLLPFSRRVLLRRAAWCALGWPALARMALAPHSLLAATAEVAETEDNMEGPFYKAGAPSRAVLLEPGMKGTPLTITGRVLDTQGHPLRGALLDIWHADASGVYDNQGYHLRGRLYTNDDGRYTLRTIKPAAYGLPTEKRPVHVHVKASFERGPILTTQLYFNGDPWNRQDPAVRPSLIMSPQREADGLKAQFDFVIKAS
jgi:protocatechuate 3,4-dioxygenase beta subunit